jgi:hypothetical protein
MFNNLAACRRLRGIFRLRCQLRFTEELSRV